MISNRFYRNSDKKLISKMGEDTAILLEIVKQRFFKNSGLSAVFIQGNCPISAEIFCSKLCDLWPTIEIVISRKLDHAGDLYKFLIIFLPCINDTNLQTSVAFTQLSNLCSDRFNFKNLKINPVSSKDFEMIFTKNYKLLKFSEFLVNINFAVATNYDYLLDLIDLNLNLFNTKLKESYFESYYRFPSVYYYNGLFSIHLAYLSNNEIKLFLNKYVFKKIENNWQLISKNFEDWVLSEEVVADVKETFGFEAELFNFSLLYYNYKNEMLTFFKKYAKEFEIEFDYTKIGLIEGKCFDLISQKVCLTGELPNLYKYEGPIDFNNTKSNNKFLSISRQICLCLASPVLWLSATNVKLILSNKLELLLVDINILETAPSIIPQGYYILNLDLFVVLIKKVGPFKVEDLGIIQVTANCSSAKFHLNQVLFSVVSSVFVSAEGNFDYMQVKDLVL